MIAKFINHLKKAERGQSIIILAFAFVALLGFVGLTTDVSLMFVRYATIRRAVDSASIAAATQMRQGTEEAGVQIAAKQFVEFHGLDSVNVLVETCQTLNRNPYDPADPDAPPQASDELAAELCTADQRKLVKVTVQAESPTTFLKLLGFENFTLEASAISETAALDVVLIMDVSESMLTDTSYDDWAKIGMGWAYKPPHIVNDIATPKGIDGGVYWETDILANPQSVVNDRLVYANVDHATLDTANGDTAGDDADYEVVVMELDSHPDGLYDPVHGFPDNASSLIPRPACRVRFNPPDNVSPRSFHGRAKREGTDPSSYADVIDLHEVGTDPENGLYGEFSEDYTHGNFFGGFVPTYNYYGCCNDPGTHSSIDEDTGYAVMRAQADGGNEADFDFTDLICQPFKGARDAVELFLEKIDFIRGDRVAFVTFDRTAFLINPWNQDGQVAGGSHMIDRYDYALNTLRRVVGIRAEPNFYVWDDTLGDVDTFPPNAGWGAFSAGIRRDSAGISGSIPINFNSPDGSGTYYGHLPSTGFDYVAGADIKNNYPVKNNCALVNSMLPKPYSVNGATLGQVSLPYPGKVEIYDDGGIEKYKNPEPRDQLGDPAASWGSYSPFDKTFDSLLGTQSLRTITDYSYEKWAGCRGTNIGAALREGNNALLDPSTSRRFGAIWVMVLLGDGAAGASDPVRRNLVKLSETQPYLTNVSDEPTPLAGEYGAFGVCPYGVPGSAGEAVDVSAEISVFGSPGFPWCSDEDPVSRHDCDFRPANEVDENPMEDADYVSYPDTVPLPLPLIGVTGPKTADTEIQWNQDRGNLFDLDIGNCDTYYDVDDYARDWADFIALPKDNAVSEELLPTIYTIGFGLTFDEYPDVTTDPYHLRLIDDYLGEQMLRYIADVGDNNQLDNDYYQHYDEDNTFVNPEVLKNSDGVYEYGVRGSCQDLDVTVLPGANGYDKNGAPDGSLDGNELEDMYAPLAPKVDCGNYFNAPSADRLDFVFDKIASKLFTRLTG